MRVAYGFKSYKRSHSGDDSNEVPPVPIPNTEVKLVYARSSWVLTLQDKVVAGFHFKRSIQMRILLFLCFKLSRGALDNAPRLFALLYLYYSVCGVARDKRGGNGYYP